MLAYCGAQISPHMDLTPEGFDVPINGTALKCGVNAAADNVAANTVQLINCQWAAGRF